jgi:hypothetical protein
LIYRDPEISCFEPLPVRPRPMPPALPSLMTDKEQAHGVFYLQDVYRSTQGIPRGTIRRLRVNELIPQPTQRVPYSSAVRFEVLKRVLGTVPVDESGSVAFEAPAGVPLQFQALDQDGLAVMTMRTFTHVQPGEVVGCVGCHEPRTSSPVSPSAPPAGREILQLEPPAGPQYPGGLSFAKTVQPVLDRYCLDCHGLKETAGKIDLLGTIDWLDLNAPLYGTYSWNKDEWRRPNPEGEQALRAHVRQRLGEELAGQPFAALVNVALPEESRILKAPLALAAGGWGQIERGGWKSTDDPEYRGMRDLVQAAIQPLPYHDIAGTCGRDETCRCLSCWVRKLQEEQQKRLTAAR